MNRRGICSKWPSRTAGRAIFLGMLLMVWAVAWSPLKAHEANHTHPSLAAASLEVLGSSLFGPQQRENLLAGTIEEDSSDEETHEIRVLYHFYNPITGKNRVLGVTHKTARQMAGVLWSSATDSYFSSPGESFHSLGRTLHLLQDMTSPAHVHDDAHTGLESPCAPDDLFGSIDDFEMWGWCTSISENRIRDYVTPTLTAERVIDGRMTQEMKGLLDSYLGRRPRFSLDLSPGGFIDELAKRVYLLTTYDGTLRIGAPSEGELKQMFPSLSYDSTSRAWRIGDVGSFFGACAGTQDDDWWGMEDQCLVSSNGLSITGGFYIENTGGNSNSLTPAVWKKEGTHPTGPNSKPLMKIYGDNLYPLAVTYGAGLLKVFDEVVRKPQHFSDVRESVKTDWFAPYVRYVHLQGVVEGYGDGTFRPNAATTRAEALKMAYAGAGEPISGSAPDPGFADVHTGDWFYDLVADAKAKGFVTGESCVNGSGSCFHPLDPVNRAEATKLVSVLLQVDFSDLGRLINGDLTRPVQFPDVDFDDWFYPYVYWLTNSALPNGFPDFGLPSGAALLVGYDDRSFHPERLITRGEMAKLLTHTMLYCLASTRTNECRSGKSIFASVASDAKLAPEPRIPTIGTLYEQVSDATNLNSPQPFHLPGGDQQTVTAPIPLVGDTRDADGDTLFYFWSASGGSFTTSDPVNFSSVTWRPPTVSEDTLFTVDVVRGDRRGLVGRGSFRFLVPGMASNSPGSGTITGPNGTQTGAVTVSATASDADGLSRVYVTFTPSGPAV
ncbi:MAG TPA: S-layer homology domain-containing protein, partial [Thermoanaerobaculia bacterium]|nr:S-layer homology domain-containing protein [Thermoanaerobaculia bacterium]